ncbi:MAG: hypothetical protein HMLKMBBP_01634 [Planctomycetes bacterium]|nr:hypothetical protein [Planctomycetota bacterium]
MYEHVPEHLKPVVARIARATLQPLPDPWLPPIWHPVGGLASVGFAPDSELLLVTSSAGRGVFDCITGERVARDDDVDARAWEDPFSLTARGIGPLGGTSIRMTGLYGGGLPTLTRAGWQAETVHLDWLNPMLLLVAPGSDLLDCRAGHEAQFWRVESGAGALRAWGFSSTGSTLLLATSADIRIFCRRTNAT